MTPLDRMAAFAAAFFLAGIQPLAASDYSHLCRSGDNAFVMEDGKLYEAHKYDAGDALEEVAFTELARLYLRQKNGHCLANADQPPRSHQHKYEIATYLLRIRFSLEGTAREADLICELVADGLPANRDCDKDVVTFEATLPLQAVKATDKGKK